MKYGSINLGQIEALINKIGGEQGVKGILRGDFIVVPKSQQDFRAWRTLKLGTGLKTANEFREALEMNGDQISDWAHDILDKPAFTASDTEIEVELVVRSVEELGFKDGATREQIHDRAKEIGLDLCPAEVGPQLRLQYKDQPKGECLLIAMEPIAASDGVPSAFHVEHCTDGARYLGRNYENPGLFRGSSIRWVFLRRRVGSPN